MILSSIFAVAIGLLILWIVLSFATIQIQEWVSTRLSKRARIEADAIHQMFANPNLKAQFYDHPIIRGLSSKEGRGPSQIQPWLYHFHLVRGFIRKKGNFHIIYLPSNLL